MPRRLSSGFEPSLKVIAILWNVRNWGQRSHWRQKIEERADSLNLKIWTSKIPHEPRKMQIKRPMRRRFAWVSEYDMRTCFDIDRSHKSLTYGKERLSQ